jgi:hypothetical protein
VSFGEFCFGEAKEQQRRRTRNREFQVPVQVIKLFKNGGPVLNVPDFIKKHEGSVHFVEWFHQDLFLIELQNLFRAGQRFFEGEVKNLAWRNGFEKALNGLIQQRCLAHSSGSGD